MDQEKLFELLEEELEYLDSEAIKYNQTTEEGKTLERIAKKVCVLKYILECRNMSPTEVKEANYSFSTKELILSLFHPKELIGDFLKKEG